ncbi:hypothetical protein [Desulfoscipio gibsoniae]|nr:hypothetical protein [Desulfoscipio gibsoniae]
MVCFQCTDNFQPSFLVSESAQTCKKCKKVKDLIKYSTNLSSYIYSINLQNKFNMISPSFNGNELIYFNPKFIDEGYTEKEVFLEIIDCLNLQNTYYNNVKIITNVCNQMMGLIIDRINDLISDNPKGYLISLLNILEYNLHLTFITISWLSDKENNIIIEEITDNFARVVINSLKFQRDYNFLGRFEQIYKEWEGVLSFDKLAFQYGIEIVTYLSDKKQINNSQIDPINFKKLIATIRAMYELLFTCESAYEHKELIIDKKGNISTKKTNNYSEIAKKYVDCMINRKVSSFDIKTINKLNMVCKKYIGISLEEISKIIGGLQNHYVNSDDFLIGSVDYFQKLIKHLLQCSDKDAEKFLSILMSARTNNFIFATSTSLRENRPLRKCLITIEDDIVACPISILEFSLIGLYLDITYATLPKSPFQKELFTIVDKYVHKKFESDVILHLKNNFIDAFIKGDIEKDNMVPDIEAGRGFLQLPGQIDIIMLYRNKMFVIECKDIGLKYTPKSILNEVYRFRKIGNKSFQNKLSNKVESVYNNWDSIVAFLGVSSENKIQKHMPISLFVTDTFSVAAIEKDLPSPVVPFQKLIEWINQQV